MLGTIFFAKLMGIFAVLEGLSMVLRRRMLREVFHEMAQSRTTSYIIGSVMAILGLPIIVSHTTFSNLLASVVTLIGWLIFIEGASSLFLSKTAIARIVRTLDNPSYYYAIGFGYLVVGVYLLLNAFGV